MHKTLDDAWEP